MSKPRAKLRRFLPFLAFLAVFGAASAAEGGQAGVPAETALQENHSAESLASDKPLEGAAEELVEPAKELDLFLQTLRLDISTASLSELASWCRTLGLPDGGSKEELAKSLLSYYKLDAQKAESEGKSKLIVIESARDSKYFTLEANDEKYVTLSGSVVVTMRDEEKGETHRIEAEEIVFNETQNTMSARGKVVYTLTKPDGVDYFIGESLTVDLDTWKGDFLAGLNKKSLGASKDQSTFSFAADRIMKSEGSVVVFENGTISSCEDEDPHFAIRAEKMWILGANEWAIQSAILTVGNLPVLYLPFFYYPAEEIIFHPVLGYREREGRFIQTTTYILGEKPAQTEKLTIFQLAKSSTAYEREIRGLFYRTTDRKKGDSSKDVLKVMADFYANLGVYVAAEAHIASRESFPKIDVSIGFARSRNVYYENSLYTPFIKKNNFVDVWNYSTILGQSFWLRYGIDLTSSFTFKSLSFNFQLPLYSDPFFDQDFKNRAENMDWLSFIGDKASPTAVSEKTQTIMKLDMSFSPSIPEISPYIQSIGVNSASTALTWNVKPAIKEDGKSYDSVDPARKFFYPSQWSFLNASFSLRGSLFSWPPKASEQKPQGSQAMGVQPGAEKGGLNEAEKFDAGAARAPWESVKDPKEGEQGKATKTPVEDLPVDMKTPERMKDIQTAAQAAAKIPFTFNLGYSASPTLGTEGRFDSGQWKNAEGITSDLLYTIFTTKLSGSANFTGAVYESAFTFTGGINFLTQYEAHPYVNGTSKANPPAVVTGYTLEEYKYRTDKLSGTLRLSSSPFPDFALFKKSTFQYGIDAVLYDMKFLKMDTTNPALHTPIYQTNGLDFTKTTISAHNFGFTFSFSQDPVQVPAPPPPFRDATSTQTQGQTISINPGSLALTLTSNIPPLDPSITGSFTLDAWLLKLSGQSKIYQKTNDTAWYFDPLTLSASASLPWNIKVSDSFQYNLQNMYPVSNSLSLSYENFSSAFSMRRSKAYQLVQGTGWKVDSASAEELRASDFSFSYRNTWKPEAMWKNRLTLQTDLASSLSMNIIRPTETNFTFNLTLSLKINKFLELSFISMSQNSNVYRYFVGLPGFDNALMIQKGWVNPVLDLAESFGFRYDETLKSIEFFSDKARKDSLFKLKSLTVKATHDLEDWDLSFEYTGKPELGTSGGKKVYLFNSYVSVYLKWKTIPEIKTQVTTTPTTVTLK